MEQSTEFRHLREGLDEALGTLIELQRILREVPERQRELYQGFLPFSLAARWQTRAWWKATLATQYELSVERRTS